MSFAGRGGEGAAPGFRMITSARAVSLAVLGMAALAVAVPFFTATTFIGDDHLFLAYARHAPNPLVAFVSDAHGGEYYRPLPMLVWWLLLRVGGGRVPFAILGLTLHLSVAAAVAGCSEPWAVLSPSPTRPAR